MKKTAALLLLLISSTCLHAQQAPLDTLVKKFEQYREAALQEKMYAHLDRDFYLTGETLWFKIYTVDGTFHRPIDLSKVAYVEILDRANFPVLRGKIALDNGMGNGSFFIPASLSSGHYKFRVYTSWMKNFRPEFYFHKVFTIVNPFVAPVVSRDPTTPTCTIDFFPEGGNLVAGIQSKVAFKISDSRKMEAFCKGFLLNEQNDTVATFTPGKFGIGNFLFTPELNEEYRAVLTNSEGVSRMHPFPEIFKSGFVMQLRDGGEMLHVTVTSRGVSQEDVYLFVHARHIMTVAERRKLQNNTATFDLPKTALQEGISHLTVFTEDLQPVCERLYFRYPNKKLKIEIASSQKIFGPRKEVSLSFQTGKESDSAVPANLSMAVYKIDSLSTGSPKQIFPYLWLGADLTGVMESPEYYFQTGQPGTQTAMDNLMLTHGWRRFDWKGILGDKTEFKYLPEARGHIITGVITKGQERQRSVFTYLGSPGKIIRAYGSWSSAEGEVRFEIKDFYGARRIILQTKTDSADIYNIAIQDPFSPFTDNEKLGVLELDPANEKALLARSIAMQVQDIFYYEAFGNRPILPEVDSAAFYGKADATYYLDDYTRFPVMEEVMREYVPGVFVRKRRDGFHFIVVDAVRGGILSGDPMVLLDGVPILDVDDIMALDPLRVRKLEVVQREYYLGQAMFSGIVSYTTYQGDMGGMELDPQSLSLNYDGLQLKRRFYSPTYTRQEVDDRMPDQRVLLHWQPDIRTGEDGKYQQEFFTSDIPGTYLVVVEGLSDDGYAGSKTYTFEVVPPDNQ